MMILEMSMCSVDVQELESEPDVQEVDHVFKGVNHNMFK